MDILEKVLSDEEKAGIAAFLANPVMKEAVRKVLLAGIYYNGTLEAGKAADPAVNFALQWGFRIDVQNADVSDEALGQDVRASVRGIRMLEQGFKQLEEYAPKPASTPAPRHNKGK